MRNFGIVLLSHGAYAKATLESLEMIAGQQEGILALELDVNKSADQLKEELKSSTKTLGGKYEHVLVLCDLYGGTPFNQVLATLFEGDDYIAYSGFNLPLALAAALGGELDEQGIKDLVKSTFEESLFDLSELITQDQQSDNTDL